MTVKRTNRKTRTTYPLISAGCRFGRLVVLAHAGMRNGQYHLWLCQCDCGGEPRVILQNSLNTGNTASCGCLQTERHRAATTTHGKHKSREYHTWDSMIQRCTNPHHKQFHDYGGRGIAVCERWLLFVNFYEDMGDCPAGHTIDRQNNELGYTPDNCRWATRATQARNRSNNRWVILRGERMVFADALDALGLSRSAGGKLLRRGDTHQILIDRWAEKGQP